MCSGNTQNKPFRKDTVDVIAIVTLCAAKQLGAFTADWAIKKLSAQGYIYIYIYIYMYRVTSGVY